MTRRWSRLKRHYRELTVAEIPVKCSFGSYHSFQAQASCERSISIPHRAARSRIQLWPPARTACPARRRQLHRLDDVPIRRDCNNDVGEPVWNSLLPDHPAPRRLVIGVGPLDCSHVAALVRVSVFLVLPGFTSLEGKLALEIRKALNGFSIFPREFEIDVLKLVVKTDLTRVRESCAEVHPIDARPIDGAHTHRAGSTIHVKIAPFEHLRAFGNWIGRTFGTRNHF